MVTLGRVTLVVRTPRMVSCRMATSVVWASSPVVTKGTACTSQYPATRRWLSHSNLSSAKRQRGLPTFLQAELVALGSDGRCEASGVVRRAGGQHGGQNAKPPVGHAA